MAWVGIAREREARTRRGWLGEGFAGRTRFVASAGVERTRWRRKRTQRGGTPGLRGLAKPGSEAECCAAPAWGCGSRELDFRVFLGFALGPGP